jgi:hypothetical protein
MFFVADYNPYYLTTKKSLAIGNTKSHLAAYQRINDNHLKGWKE